MLSIELSGLVLIRIFLRRHNSYHLYAYLLACFYEKHFKSLTSHIYFYLDDSELWKQYHSVSQEMMEQICDLETVKPQEIPIKVYVIFYYIGICYRCCGYTAIYSLINCGGAKAATRGKKKVFLKKYPWAGSETFVCVCVCVCVCACVRKREGI